jgi:hypothetical protein
MHKLADYFFLVNTPERKFLLFIYDIETRCERVSINDSFPICPFHLFCHFSQQTPFKFCTYNTYC